MQVSFEIPEDLAQQFAADKGGISRTALEAFAVEGIRSGKLTVFQARQMLGIHSRYEMDGFLKTHGVFPSTTLDDVVRDSLTATDFSK